MSEIPLQSTVVLPRLPDGWRLTSVISQKIFEHLFLSSQFTHKPVNFLFTIPCYKIKLNGFVGELT